MDQTHIHLLANHLPVIGSILAVFVLLYGMFTANSNTKNAAYFLFIIAALGGVITYLTGEAAEETVETIAGINNQTVETHEDLGLYALVSLIILGVAALVSLIAGFKNSVFSKPLSYITLFIALITFGITAYTANSGGKIRHPEISGDQITVPSEKSEAKIKNQKNDDDDDD